MRDFSWTEQSGAYQGDAFADEPLDAIAQVEDFLRSVAEPALYTVSMDGVPDFQVDLRPVAPPAPAAPAVSEEQNG